MAIEKVVNVKTLKKYNELNLFDVARASIQPGFTFMDAEIKAGNKKSLTTEIKVMCYVIETAKWVTYASIVSQNM